MKNETKKTYSTPKLVKLGDIGTVTQVFGSLGGGSCGSASICDHNT